MLTFTLGEESSGGIAHGLRKKSIFSRSIVLPPRGGDCAIIYGMGHLLNLLKLIFEPAIETKGPLLKYCKPPAELRVKAVEADTTLKTKKQTQ